MAVVRHKAAIHSGHFMISDFEPDEPDEDESAAIVPPEEGSNIPSLIIPDVQEEVDEAAKIADEQDAVVPVSTLVQRIKNPSGNKIRFSFAESKDKEISLSALFRSMSIAYRQRLTSPRWNRFRGLKLRWKDKIRLNNVIWRCWHMQFMKNEPRSLCAFANPMEIDNHGKMEGSTLLEGKYWKRKFDTIAKEYRHWRTHYSKNDVDEDKFVIDKHIEPYSNEWDRCMKSPIGRPLVEGSQDDVDLQSMLNDEGLIVDLLLNTLQESNSIGSELTAMLATSSGSGAYGSSQNNGLNVAIPFPNPKDYYKTTTNADLLQPGLGPLQPNLDDFDLDWFATATTSSAYSNGSVSANGIGGKSIKSMTQQQNEEKDFVSMVVSATTSSTSINEIPCQGQCTISQPDHQHQPQQQQIIPQRQQHLVHHQAVAAPQQLVPKHTFPNQTPAPTLMSIPHNAGVLVTSHPAPVHPQTTTILPPNTVPPYTSSIPMTTPQPPNGGVTYDLSMNSGGGGKRRLPVTSPMPSLPYPSGAYNVSVPQKSNAHPPTQKMKVNSKQRALQQRNHTTHPNYNTTSSELVQLLKPKTEAIENLTVATRPTLPQEYNGRHYNQNNHLHPMYTNIPPPLATDYAQEISAVRKQRGQGDHHRRAVHVNCEQNRRTSIKHGFEDLRALIPSLRNVPSSGHKISKAALLHKGGDYLRQMKNEMRKMDEDSAILKMNIEKCELEVSALQGCLPDGGIYSSLMGNRSTYMRNNTQPSAPISGKLRQKRAEQDSQDLEKLFHEHVRNGTQVNWKYWAFSRIMRPLFDSFAEAVSGSVSLNEVERASTHWSEHKCQLIQIRQHTLNSLKNISIQTNILEEPHRMPSDAITLAQQTLDQNGSQHHQP